MKWNIKRELARKFVHILSVLVLLVYFLVSDYFSSRIALFILVLILVVFLELEYFRIEWGGKVPLLGKIWKYVRRDKERDKLGGDVFFLVGAILVLAIFDVRIAIAAILMTTFGDLAAALVGQKFGRHWFMKERAWEGTLAEFFVDLVIGGLVLFWGVWNFANVGLWVVVLVMALTATVVETLIYKMDDNLLIPVFAGFNGQVALLVLNYLF